YRQAVGRYKTSLAADLALAHRGPILVWTWHKQIAQAIAKRVSAESDRETFVMSGESTGAKRAKTIDAWNATEAGVMVATLAVGQVGIDLSHARKEIFVETDWTPAVLSQAEVRPFHPDRDLDIVYITLDHEIDQALTEAVVKKVDRGHSFDLAAAGSVFEDSAVAAQDDDRDILRDLAAALGLAA
ncbi:MAG TPA: helicase-related protein, partial [Acidimicrobiales bacterium]